MQAANCCCENRAAIAQVRYDMAAQACDTRNTVQNATRDIIDNANSNSRAILDFLTQSKLSDLQAENQGLKLAASQAAQNSYLVSQLPAFSHSGLHGAEPLLLQPVCLLWLLTTA